MRYEYLLFNIIVGFPPLASTFFLKEYRRLSFIRAIVSIMVVAMLFIVWDIFVVGSWWFFNSRFVLGWSIVGLPVEEWLFFLTVPFACMVIWQQLRRFEIVWIAQHWWMYVLAIVLLLLGVGALVMGRYYTCAVLLLSSCMVLVDTRSFGLLRRKSGICFLFIVGVLLFIFDGYLTMRPIVLYNPAVKLPIQIGTIPVEDFFYGWNLVMVSVLLYEYLLRKKRYVG